MVTTTSRSYHHTQPGLVSGICVVPYPMADEPCPVKLNRLADLIAMAVYVNVDCVPGSSGEVWEVCLLQILVLFYTFRGEWRAKSWTVQPPFRISLVSLSERPFAFSKLKMPGDNFLSLT